MLDPTPKPELPGQTKGRVLGSVKVDQQGMALQSRPPGAKEKNSPDPFSCQLALPRRKLFKKHPGDPLESPTPSIPLPPVKGAKSGKSQGSKGRFSPVCKPVKIPYPQRETNPPVDPYAPFQQSPLPRERKREPHQREKAREPPSLQQSISPPFFVCGAFQTPKDTT